MGLRAFSPTGPSVSWLGSPSPMPVHELAHCLGAQLLGLGGREDPRQGLAGTWVVGGAPPSGWFQTSRSLPTWTSGSTTGVPRTLRLQSRLGCAPIRNFGLKSQGAQWNAYGWVEPSRVLMLTPNCKPSRLFSVQELDL